MDYFLSSLGLLWTHQQYVFLKLLEGKHLGGSDIDVWRGLFYAFAVLVDRVLHICIALQFVGIVLHICIVLQFVDRIVSICIALQFEDCVQHKCIVNRVLHICIQLHIVDRDQGMHLGCSCLNQSMDTGTR